MLERTGSKVRRFEPVPADQIHDLEWLHEQLDQVNWYSEDMTASVHGYGFLGLWTHRLGFRFCCPPNCLAVVGQDGFALTPVGDELSETPDKTTQRRHLMARRGTAASINLAELEKLAAMQCTDE